MFTAFCLSGAPWAVWVWQLALVSYARNEYVVRLVSDRDMTVTQTTENTAQRPDAAEVRQQLAGKHVCPFCGVIRAEPAQPCPRCTMEDTTATRTATRQRIGPWFVLQARNPSAPGMKFFTLLSLVKKGHVTPRSIVRGPTTQQLWTFASRVRGLSREFGLCSNCGEGIEATTTTCPHCARPQDPPAEPDVLLEHDTHGKTGATGGTPQLTLSAATNPETGMDGGASLDLQADHAFGTIGTTPSPTRAQRPSRPSVTSAPTSSLASSTSSATPSSSNRANLPAKTTQSEEAILSAKELAAAFQLDFNPPPKSRGPVVETKPLAARGASAPKRFGALKAIVVLIFIAAAAVAIVLTLRQDLRERSFAWASAKWASIKTTLDAPANKPETPTGTPTVKPTPKPTPPVVQIPAPAPKPEPKIETPPAPKPEPPVEIVKADPPPAPTPPPEPKVETPPTPAPPPKPVEVPEVDPNVDLDQAIAIAQQLRKNAIDAEGHDWAGALRLYEQIQKLPQEAWPTDLQIRINRAKANLR